MKIKRKNLISMFRIMYEEHWTYRVDLYPTSRTTNSLKIAFATDMTYNSGTTIYANVMYVSAG